MGSVFDFEEESGFNYETLIAILGVDLVFDSADSDAVNQDKLVEGLITSQAECDQLLNSLIDTWVSKQYLEEQVGELKYDKSELLEKIRLMLIKEADLAEQHNSEILKSNETIKELEKETRFLRARLSLESAKVERLNAVHLFKYQEMEAKMKDIIHELDCDKEYLLARLSVEACNAEHFRALSSEYKEQQELEEAKLKEIIEKLKTEKNELRERLSTAGSILVDFHEISTKCIDKHKVEKDKLNGIISQLEHENLVLTDTVEHFRTLSTEYKEAKENLQEKLDDLEYDII